VRGENLGTRLDLRGLNSQFNIQPRLAMFSKWSTVHITTRYCVPYHNATTTDSITNRGWGWTLYNELACLTYPLHPVGVVTWLPRQGLALLLYIERIISQLPVQPQM